MSINAIVSNELVRFPRGDDAQNIFRAVYQMARAHGLGKRATTPPTREAAMALAVRLVRRPFPDFIPTLSGQQVKVAAARLGPPPKRQTANQDR